MAGSIFGITVGSKMLSFSFFGGSTFGSVSFGWGAAFGIPQAATQLFAAASSALFGLTSIAGHGAGLIWGVPIGVGAPFEMITPVTIEAPDQVVVLSFDDVSGLIPGSPVVVNGQIAGRVEKIAPRGDVAVGNAETTCNAKGACTRKLESNFSVDVTIVGEHTGDLKLGTVGVITSPSSHDELSALELLVPKDGSPLDLAAPISGFSSFEKFWTSDGLI